MTRVWPISWLAISRPQAYFARFTTPERSEGLVSRGQWSKQTNEPIRARITSVRVDGRALNAGKNRGNVTILPLIGGGCFARLGHSIENYYTGRRYIRHWLPTPHLDTITFNPGVELETGKCIVELRFIILALLACVHHSLMQLKIHRFPILHNWLPERAGVNPVFWLAATWPGKASLAF